MPMVAKKRKSKRITTRQREKVAKKVREHHRNLRRTTRKAAKKSVVPASIYRTEEEKTHFEDIKKNAQYRQKIYEAAGKNKHTKTLAGIMETCDVVLEFVDARDPLGSSSREVLDLVAATGKPCLKIYYNAPLVPAETLRKWLVRDQALVDTDIGVIDTVLSSFGEDEVSVVVAANSDFNEKSFLGAAFSKKIKAERVVTTCDTTLRSVLRNVGLLSMLNCREYIEGLVSRFSKVDLLLRYKVPDFITVDEFLNSVGSQMKFFTRSGKVDLVKTAAWIVEDTRNNYLFFADNDNLTVFVPRGVAAS